jgi:hypothetical protein
MKRIMRRRIREGKEEAEAEEKLAILKQLCRPSTNMAVSVI